MNGIQHDSSQYHVAVRDNVQQIGLDENALDAQKLLGLSEQFWDSDSPNQIFEQSFEDLGLDEQNAAKYLGLVSQFVNTEDHGN